jgi:UDP-glucose 4-epimerase
VRQLGEAGYNIVVYDNCSTGVPQSVLHGELIIGDLGDIDRLYNVFGKHQFSAVLHFAASLVVPESVAYPLDYYANNTRNTLNLLRCCSVMDVNQLIFSSTAAVYGEPQENPVTESTPTLPINPYGRSKLMSEFMIQDYGLASRLRYVILRYFNVAGADPGGRIGQNSKNATHLIANACNAALKRQSEFKIFGTDFATSDGTGIRDYIHVEDLAAAHVDALRYLERDGESQILNCGYGKGYSFLEIVRSFEKISKKRIKINYSPRRKGDIIEIISNTKKLNKFLKWKSKYSKISAAVKSALAWEKKLKI